MTDPWDLQMLPRFLAGVSTRSDDGATAGDTRATFQGRTDPRLKIGGPRTVAFDAAAEQSATG